MGKRGPGAPGKTHLPSRRRREPGPQQPTGSRGCRREAAQPQCEPFAGRPRLSACCRAGPATVRQGSGAGGRGWGKRDGSGEGGGRGQEAGMEDRGGGRRGGSPQPHLSHTPLSWLGHHGTSGGPA